MKYTADYLNLEPSRDFFFGGGRRTRATGLVNFYKNNRCVWRKYFTDRQVAVKEIEEWEAKNSRGGRKK